MNASDQGTSYTALTTEEKRLLLTKLLQQKLRGFDEEYPLSYGQQALWFLSKLAPGMVSYNVAIPAVASPPLDLAVFQSALRRVVERHQALRTIVSQSDAEPTQRVWPAEKISINIFECRHSAPADIRNRVAADLNQRFDLSASLPIRASIYRCDTADVILIAVHHIAFDAWSAQILLDDLRTAYVAELEGAEPIMRPLTFSYSNFVQQQRQAVAGPAGDESWHYWSEQLRGELPILRLPFAANPAVQSYKGGSIPLTIDGPLLEAVRSIAQQQKTTLFTAMVVAWGLFLCRLVGQEEIVIGMPVSGRTRPQWETVIGYFVNLVPIRLSFDSRKTFADMVRSAVGTVHDALAHQDFPFAVLVDRLKIRRNTGSSPIFQTMLNLQRAYRRSDLGDLFRSQPNTGLTFGRSYLQAFPIPQQEGQFDVVLELAEFKDCLEGHIKYSASVMTDEVAARLAGQFISMLNAMATRPQTSVANLPPPVASLSVVDSSLPEEDRDELSI